MRVCSCTRAKCKCEISDWMLVQSHTWGGIAAGSMKRSGGTWRAMAGLGAMCVDVGFGGGGIPMI